MSLIHVANLTALLILGCAGPRSSSPRPVPAATTEGNAERCRNVMAALATGDFKLAERDFDARMRSELPPEKLRAVWLGLTSTQGRLASWHVLRQDAVSGKDRFTLEVEFARSSSYALIVFGSNGQIVGLFFSARPTHPTSRIEPIEGESPISVGPLDLPGSLVLPKARTSRVPAAVLVAGSGPTDRDETVGNVRPFRDLARGLAARGIASLRFDKRTYVHPEAFDQSNSTVEAETLIDAVAAVELLRARPEVDAERLFVIGHSLGALLAPEIAERAGRIAGLVLLSPPGRPLPGMLLEQLRARGEDPASLAKLEAQVKALPQLPPSEPVFGVPASYWQDLAGRDEVTRAANLGLPVLVLRGALDAQVAPIDQDNWVKALTGRAPVEAETFPGLTHLFVPDQAPDPPHVASAVIDTICAFILNSTGRGLPADARRSHPS